MKYTWDEKKSKINYEKHGIRFEEAQVIWSDPNSLEYFDTAHSFLEERYIRVGLNPWRGILLVVFCEREGAEIIRIISARRATFQERIEYEEELRSQKS